MPAGYEKKAYVPNSQKETRAEKLARLEREAKARHVKTNSDHMKVKPPKKEEG